MDNKRNKGTLSSLLDNNKKENTKNPHEILHKNKTINYNIIKLNKFEFLIFLNILINKIRIVLISFERLFLKGFLYE